MSTTTTSATMQVSAGILIVGLGGNNGVTLLAGQIANRLNLSWETSTCGRISANWYGCLTQIPPRGIHGRGVGFQGRIPGLASANEAVVGGWDIRPTQLGQALYDCRVLEPDLVRQVREEMDKVEIMEGVWDPSFIGESQHDTATHVVSGEDNASTRTRVERIRSDIRKWREKNNVNGHVTVIWSASVERPSEADYASTDDLLNAIYDDGNKDDISPSMCYAAAAALEGCSFVNGGSQNTLSSAMNGLFDENYRKADAPPACPLSKFAPYSSDMAYCLGTDYKAGQTKFKTAAVEYLRALGLAPRVIASSNHLGNNDMLNLTTKKTLNAKMRVKSDIFGPWEEKDLDHKVCVMYTEFIGDEKRDFVEYTSLGFLGSPHTMVTYTRCMDSILCVPLMVDAAIWCDYFVNHKVSKGDAARATAYLFKVPEGEAKGVDPGFFHQMSELEKVLEKTSGIELTVSKKRKIDEVDSESDIIAMGVKKGIISEDQAAALRGLK
mmetsp:Transcript_14494/g.28996  ORF Transcript_14494/g.28996 Transcript_14494/m.28996 type:complete len:496 (-) Transcript_14494:1516-3003(-)